MILFKEADNPEYYIEKTKFFYEKNTQKKIEFIKNNKFFYNQISKYLNNILNNSESVFMYCCGNSIIKNKIKSDIVAIQDIDKIFMSDSNYNSNKEIKINEYKTIVIADIEHQKNPIKNLENLHQNIDDECKIIVISKSLIWSIFIKIYKLLFKDSFTSNYNFLPFNYIKNIIDINNFEIIRNEKAIVLPINIPIISNFLNKIFRLPILNFFCMLNFTVIKKKIIKKDKIFKKKISVIIPCKNEEENIKLISNQFCNLGYKTEFIFGNDKSEDNTVKEIKKIHTFDDRIEIKLYEGPGICKADNVFKGIDECTGDIVLIYDADSTVTFDDIKIALNTLQETNADFINCTRMIYPQQKGAMKFFNFFGNIFFAYLFSSLFNQKITDTLCGTKIFYKKNWSKIKSTKNLSNIKDHWGDYDLLIGAYNNNLKIREVPVKYRERTAGETKMTSVFQQGLRMFKLLIFYYFKIRVN